MIIHDALRLVRRFHGLSQVDFAARLAISKSYLNEIESGKKSVTFNLLERYSRALDIPVSHLMLFVENAGVPSAGEKVRRSVARKAVIMLDWIGKNSDSREEG